MEIKGKACKNGLLFSRLLLRQQNSTSIGWIKSFIVSNEKDKKDILITMFLEP